MAVGVTYQIGDGVGQEAHFFQGDHEDFFCNPTDTSLTHSVSPIKTMDGSRSGSTSYHVGPPFTPLLTVSLEI